ncbi:GntR family transcriptional repressor for pyruvate dehydrogenase complex [Isoptericola jiangsuensis]|uniref:GntR family transcriptional repressor for pyruvate dehydrogenase complex n=1 Tax=Isoptericola jiangsuensis TaxID=548579 RepID=A0A2A9EUQ9_9MICO|nr:FCD domain-containing protein [Isoptericola jiangsuensis]PFG42020.1 GntR family transcriptional repressor for pyruvate dehydrogenase complex [Isoptericola jiangsuensis]
MRTHERVLAQIEADLAAGRWGLGERLPGERALAEELGVSRPSVREAVRILEALGIIRAGVGSGPDAGAVVIDRPAAGLGAAVRWHVASGTLPVADVVATRAALETWAVGDAARRVGPDGHSTADDHAHDDAVRAGLSTAADLLRRMTPPEVPSDEFIRLDQEFHLEIVRLAGNQLVEAILIGLRNAVASYVTRGAEALPSWPTTAARLCTEHGAILDAVTAGDADRAVRATADHIWGFYRETGLAGA